MMSIYPNAERSKACDRDTDLFFEIADVIQFTPEQYNQGSWGDFNPTLDQREEMIRLISPVMPRTCAAGSRLSPMRGRS